MSWRGISAALLVDFQGGHYIPEKRHLFSATYFHPCGTRFSDFSAASAKRAVISSEVGLYSP